MFKTSQTCRGAISTWVRAGLHALLMTIMLGSLSCGGKQGVLENWPVGTWRVENSEVNRIVALILKTEREKRKVREASPGASEPLNEQIDRLVQKRVWGADVSKLTEEQLEKVVRDKLREQAIVLTEGGGARAEPHGSVASSGHWEVSNGALHVAIEAKVGQSSTRLDLVSDGPGGRVLSVMLAMDTSPGVASASRGAWLDENSGPRQWVLTAP